MAAIGRWWAGYVLISLLRCTLAAYSLHLPQEAQANSGIPHKRMLAFFEFRVKGELSALCSITPWFHFEWQPALEGAAKKSTMTNNDFYILHHTNSYEYFTADP